MKRFAVAMNLPAMCLDADDVFLLRVPLFRNREKDMPVVADVPFQIHPAVKLAIRIEENIHAGRENPFSSPADIENMSFLSLPGLQNGLGFNLNSNVRDFSGGDGFDGMSRGSPGGLQPGVTRSCGPLSCLP